MGVAEWSANGAGSNMGLEALYKQAVAQRLTNPDKLPVVEYKSSRPEKVGKGSTRVPEFNVTGWVARPAALSESGESEVEAIPFKDKPAPSPIKAKPTPTPVDDDEMFS
jgi:hypothetical protein